MFQCLSAVAHLHANGVEHRDIKLCDFGTAANMAPEVLGNRGRYDEKCDVWSLACAFFQLIAGQPAFSGGDVFEIAENVRSRRFSAEIPQSYPKDIARFVMQMFEADPRQRMSARQLLCEPLMADCQKSVGIVVAQEAKALSVDDTLAALRKESERLQQGIASIASTMDPNDEDLQLVCAKKQEKKKAIDEKVVLLEKAQKKIESLSTLLEDDPNDEGVAIAISRQRAVIEQALEEAQAVLGRK